MEKLNATPSPSPVITAIPSSQGRPLTSSVSRVYDLTAEYSDGKGRSICPLNMNVNAHETLEGVRHVEPVKDQLASIPNPTDSTHEY